VKRFDKKILKKKMTKAIAECICGTKKGFNFVYTSEIKGTMKTGYTFEIKGKFYK